MAWSSQLRGKEIAINIYATQGLRVEHGIDWAEEYILGLVAATADLSTTAAMVVAREAMSPNTAFKHITNLVQKGYLEQGSIPDNRYKPLSLSKKGEDYLNKLRYFYAS